MQEGVFELDFSTAMFDLRGGVYLLVTLAVFYLARKVFDWLAPYSLREQLTQADNKAVAVSFAGYLFGVGVILLSVLQGEEHTGSATTVATAFLIDSGVTVAWCMGGIALLHIARFINDKVLFRRFDNVKELVQDRNVGTGAIELGSYVGSALIIHGALTGESVDVVTDIVSTLVFFALGQLCFVLFGMLYQKITRYDIHGEIERDNVAAGISAGLNLVAMGLLLSGYIKHSDSLPGLGLWFVVATLLLITSRYMVDKLMLPGELLDEEVTKDRNWGASLTEGCAATAIALVITACFLG